MNSSDPEVPVSTASDPEPNEHSILLHPGHAADNADSPGRGLISWSPYKKDLYILSTSFLLVFSAFGATQNLQSSLNTDEGLGPTALGVLYCSLTLCSLLAPVVVKGLGSKRALLLGLTGYWLFVAANLAPSWSTLVPASAYLGFTASVLWVAEGTYLTYAAKAHGAVCRKAEGATLGSFNGIFWGFFASNQVVGNLLSLYLLQKTPEDPAASGGVASRSTHLLFAVFLSIMSVGTALAFFLRPQLDPTKAQTRDGPPRTAARGPLQLFKESMSLLGERRIQMLLPMLVYSGLQQAFIWSDFTKDVVSPSLGVSWVGGIMAAYGAADAIGSLLAGKLSKGVYSITVITTLGTVVQVSVVLFLLVKQRFGASTSDFLLLFASAALWGFGDATFNTQLSSLLAIYYPNDTEAAFAQFKIWQSLATSAACFATPHLALVTKLAIVGLVAIAAICGFLRCTSYAVSKTTMSRDIER